MTQHYILYRDAEPYEVEEEGEDSEHIDAFENPVILIR